MRKYYLILLILVLYKPSFGQGEAAVTFLVLQQSPLLQGAGQIGAAVPMQDAIGFYYNPAQLGYFSRENNLSFFFMPQKTKWFGNYYSNISFQSLGMTAGYNFKTNNNDLPLSIGVGYINNRFDYGEIVITNSNSPVPIGKYVNYDSFNCFSIGASYDYFLLFNLGFAIKSYNSVLSDRPTESEVGFGKASGTAFDFGAMIVTPISQLFFNDIKYYLIEKAFIKPKFDITLGYSMTNIGKEVYYIDPAQSDPIPRTARIGYTFDFGIEIFMKEKKLNALNYSFTAEAEDILIKRDQASSFDYQKIFGDIKFGKHLIGLKGDQDVVIHRGHIFRLFETVVIISGRFHGRGYNNRKSNGFGFSLEGIFKLLSRSIDNPTINYIANHLVLEYYDTNAFVDPGLETNFKGFAIYVRKIEL